MRPTVVTSVAHIRLVNEGSHLVDTTYGTFTSDHDGEIMFISTQYLQLILLSISSYQTNTINGMLYLMVLNIDAFITHNNSHVHTSQHVSDYKQLSAPKLNHKVHRNSGLQKIGRIGLS